MRFSGFPDFPILKRSCCSIMLFIVRVALAFTRFKCFSAGFISFTNLSETSSAFISDNSGLSLNNAITNRAAMPAIKSGIILF